MKASCWLFHVWPKWSAPVPVEMQRYMRDRQWHEEVYFVQTRVCERCGQADTRRLDSTAPFLTSPKDRVEELLRAYGASHTEHCEVWNQEHYDDHESAAYNADCDRDLECTCGLRDLLRPDTSLSTTGDTGRKG